MKYIINYLNRDGRVLTTLELTFANEYDILANQPDSTDRVQICRLVVVDEFSPNQ